MKLAAKLVAIILLEIIVLLAVDGYLAVQRETRLFQTDMQRDAHWLGNTLKAFVTETWQSEGPEQALSLLARANDQQSMLRIRWVWTDATAAPAFRPLASPADVAPVAAGRETALPVADHSGRRFLCTCIPVDVPSDRPGAIELAEPLSQLDAFAYSITLKNTILAGVLTATGGVTVVVLGLFLVGRPLDRLAEKARQVGQGDLTVSLVPRGHDELANVADSMNDMCRQLADAQEETRVEQERRIAAIEQLRHTDRLRTVGRLSASIAHELGTPLNTISIRSGMIAGGGLNDGEILENARIVKSQCERMTNIIRGLLDYARPRAPRRGLADLRQVARDTIEMLSPLAAKHHAAIALNEHSSSSCLAMVDVDQIQQVLTNLLVNALQATPPASHVEVEVRCDDVPPQAGRQATTDRSVCIAVRDDGGGISDENLKNIFEPFFTTKDVGDGTGLGLSVAYGIVQEHGGRIEATSQPGAGSCFSVYLPAPRPPNGTDVAKECHTATRLSD